MVTLYLTFHWKSVKRPFCPAGKMSCFYFVLDHLHIPLYLFSSWGKHTDVYQDLYFKWLSYIQFPVYVYYVTCYEFDNLMTNLPTHLLHFGTYYPAWVEKFCHKFSEWCLNETIVPCSSQRVNFTRKNLDYLRKERYDPMMDETLNKVRIDLSVR